MSVTILGSAGMSKKIKITCICGVEFFTYPSHIARGRGKYCSRLCKISVPVPESQKLIQREKMIGRFSGENSPTWKGDEVGYFGLHDWIEKEKGKPSRCEHCNTTSAKRFEWANISHEYKREVNDWARLCRSCHIKYDRASGTWGLARRRMTI